MPGCPLRHRAGIWRRGTAPASDWWGRRSVAAISGCWTVAEPHYLAPRRVVAAGGLSEPPVRHRPGVGAASSASQPADRGRLRGPGRSGGLAGSEFGDQGDRGDRRITDDRGSRRTRGTGNDRVTGGITGDTGISGDTGDERGALATGGVNDSGWCRGGADGASLHRGGPRHWGECRGLLFCRPSTDPRAGRARPGRGRRRGRTRSRPSSSAVPGRTRCRHPSWSANCRSGG